MTIKAQKIAIFLQKRAFQRILRELYFSEFAMDETLIQVLKAYGLSEKEAQVYLVALQMGRSPASSLARKAGLNRGTTYTLLQQLKEKQVMQSIEYKGVTHFFAITPEMLFKKLEEKYESFKQQLPAFAALAEQYDNRPRIQYFE